MDLLSRKRRASQREEVISFGRVHVCHPPPYLIPISLTIEGQTSSHSYNSLPRSLLRMESVSSLAVEQLSRTKL